MGEVALILWGKREPALSSEEREADGLVSGVEEAEGWYMLWVEGDKVRLPTLLTVVGRRKGRLPAQLLEIKGMMFSLQCKEGNFLHPNTALSLDQRMQNLTHHLGRGRKKAVKKAGYNTAVELPEGI